jgi:RNA polymerase sigma-70 factor (ECF subfamily)
MNQASEAALVAACLEGSEEAFAELVDRYKRLVYGVISQVVSDRAAVDDLAQEVFLKVHRGLRSFRGESKLSTWIFRIVRNVCVEERRKERVNASLDERDGDGRLKYHPPPATDRSFADFELRDRLEKAIALLPAEARFLIAAHYFGGRQYQDLADILGLPMGTVKTNLHRAKQQLRAIMQVETA